mmetsp:Transcript_16507/g.39517  ORF Transcript_16507/g.39517 Transcript_16507/m.39517 type:complete len:160 (+) Transcript_16507:304-783(+)|eukprot:CAMPEP_0181110578 /NCGR_PEP_ID=MMETSP1071-20121207/18794_1 /TAXON_ID=35127 /ORGANISM="Thalassiosira sp., Strain NH16" /LENGTH=159 /DNA_ID=CAMNT_0023194369 /DNA_START=251 /DNA_END=730 /DNA_ORIENTATION=-
MKKTTHFDTVEIRYYPIVLSNNPDGSYGPPIEFGWEYSTEHDTLKVSSYEQERKDTRKPRLYLSQNEREAMLRKANYTEKELKKAMRDKNSARRKRNRSNLLMNPVTKIQMSLQASVRTKKLNRGKKNLEMMRSDGSFHEHDAIYDRWWIPVSEVNIFD